MKPPTPPHDRDSVELPLIDAGLNRTEEAGTPLTNTKYRLRTKSVLILFVLFFIGVALISFKQINSESRQITNASDTKYSQVKALGRLMPENDIVIVAPPYGSGDARIAKLFIQEGDSVEAKQVIAEMDNLQHLIQLRKVAEANLAVAQASLSQVESLIGSTLKDLIAALELAEESLRIADAEHSRITKLYKENLISKTARDQSELQLVSAQKALDQTKAKLERVSGGVSQSDVELAVRQLLLAKSELERAQQALQKAYVKAPKAGTILSLHTLIGERPGNDGIAILGNTSKMQAELEIYQTDIGKIQLHQEVMLESPSLASELTGFVSRIGLEVERQSIVGTSPAANIDARIIRVIVDLDKVSSTHASKLTGLEVMATVFTERLPENDAPVN